jgi:hypothetical protein
MRAPAIANQAMAFFIERMEYNGITMKRIVPLFFLALALTMAACGMQTGPGLATRLPLAVSPTPTAAEPAQSCAFAWATHSLPDLSKELQAAIDAAGLTGISVRAEAFGEDCYSSLDNRNVGFSAMETDFRFTVQVDDLTDPAKLGETLASLLKIVEAIPPGDLTGPRPGYVGVTFRSGEDEINLWFLLEDGLASLHEGLTGADLFDRLHKN